MYTQQPKKMRGVAPRRRILIVDDEPLIWEMMGDYLGEHHDVTLAASYKEGSAALEGNSYDVLLTDRNLGDGDGDNLAQRVRQNGTPAVMYSSSNQPLGSLWHDVGDSIPKGADYLFIFKPVRLAYLRQVLEEVVN